MWRFHAFIVIPLALYCHSKRPPIYHSARPLFVILSAPYLSF